MGVAYSAERREHRKTNGHCDFCDIVDKKQQASRILYEDELVVAFNDRSPQAHKHILIVPKEHIPSCEEVLIEDLGLLEHMHTIGQRLLGQAEGGPTKNHFGFHVPPFTSVMHLHLHCLQEPFFRSSGPYAYSDGGIGFLWWRPIEDFKKNLHRTQPTKEELRSELREKETGDLGEVVPKTPSEGGVQIKGTHLI